MRVLQLFSNYKWTGPAEPAFLLARALATRGVEVHFAAMAPIPGETDAFGPRSAAAGIPFHADLGLRKHFSGLRDLRDAARLRAFVRDRSFEVLHAHLGNDHLLAAAALAGPGPRPVLVRSHHGGEGLAPSLRARWLAGDRTDGWIEVSARALEADRRVLRIPEERLWRIDPPLDLARFDPARALDDPRPAWGVGPGEFVLGVAARVQRHRRFDLLLEAFARARHAVPGLRLVVIGRGTHLDEVARAPAERLGLGAAVRFTGYLQGDAYVAALGALDALAFLVPGSDGGCRALREAMAMGKPAVATRRGMIPELVEDGRTGLLADEEPDALAAAIVAFARDPGRARALGAEAARAARARFDPDRHAGAVLGVYRTLADRLSRPGPGRGGPAGRLTGRRGKA